MPEKTVDRVYKLPYNPIHKKPTGKVGIKAEHKKGRTNRPGERKWKR